MNGASGDIGKGVSAIVIEAGKVLLTWRGEGDARRLTLPGGPARAGEPPEDTLARYVREQTGLEVRAATLAGFHFGPESWDAAFNCQLLGGALSGEAQYLGVDEALRRRDLGELTRLLLAGHERALEKDEIFDMKNAGSLYL